jgi:hypothetical protein
MMTSYGVAFLLPITVVGLGMAVTVAPLTTIVINAVRAHQTGVASGINNAVASVASLLAIAIFGAITLSSFNRALDRQLEMLPPSSSVRQTLERAHGTFVIDASLTASPGADRSAEAIIKESLASAIHVAMLFATALALAGTACAAFTIRRTDGRSLSGGANKRGRPDQQEGA